MVSHWSLRDSKSPQVSRTLLSILDNLDNAVVWIVSTGSLISKSFSPFINPQLVSQSLSCSIFFFCSQASTYLSFCFLLFSLGGLLGRQIPLFRRFSFFCWLSLDLVFWLRWGDYYYYYYSFYKQIWSSCHTWCNG